MIAFTASQKSLSAALALIAPCVPGRSPKDILKFCKLSAQKGGLRVEGNDMEKAAQAVVSEADVTGEGMYIVPFVPLKSMVDSIRGDTVSIEAGDTTATIRGERAEFSLGLGVVAEFPSMMGGEMKWKITAHGGALGKTLKNLAAFCVDSQRYAFSGELLEFSDALYLAAGDRGRIAVQKLAGASPNPVSAIVPSGTCRLFAGILEDAGDIEIQGNDSLVCVETSTVRAVGRQVEGRWPKWRDVLPYKDNLFVSCDLSASAIIAAVDQVMIAADRDPLSLPHVDFVIDNGMVRLSARNQNSAASKIEVPITDCGKKIDLAYSGNLLKLIFRAFDPDSTPTFSLFGKSNDDYWTTMECGDLKIVFGGLNPERKA